MTTHRCGPWTSRTTPRRSTTPRPAGRGVSVIARTHAHDGRIGAAPTLPAGAPVLLHPDDHELRSRTHPGRKPDGEPTDARALATVGTAPYVLHTPGHTWGGCCPDAAFPGAAFTGDALGHGGPCATGRSYSSSPAVEASARARLLTLPGDTAVHVEASARARLLTLPGDTAVHTGHGPDTTIAAERPGVPAV